MTHLTHAEDAFLARARKKFEQNADWLDFEDFAFGSRPRCIRKPDRTRTC